MCYCVINECKYESSFSILPHWHEMKIIQRTHDFWREKITLNKFEGSQCLHYICQKWQFLKMIIWAFVFQNLLFKCMQWYQILLYYICWLSQTVACKAVYSAGWSCYSNWEYILQMCTSRMSRVVNVNVSTQYSLLHTRNVCSNVNDIFTMSYRVHYLSASGRVFTYIVANYSPILIYNL